MTARLALLEDDTRQTAPVAPAPLIRSAAFSFGELSNAAPCTANTLGLEALGVMGVDELPVSAGGLLRAIAGAVVRGEPALTESVLVAMKHAILSAPDVGAKAQRELVALCNGALNLLDHPSAHANSAHR